MALTIKIMLFLGVIMLILRSYTIFATSRFNHRYPPSGGAVEIDGNRVHFTDTGGEGRRIVLLHGANSNLRDFHSSILDQLSREFRVVVLDRPGYGNSTRRTGPWLDPTAQACVLRSVLESINVKNPILLEHSWSGALVMSYLIEYPDEASDG